MALAHKGLDVEMVPTPFTGVAAIADGTSKTVPVLEDDGSLIRDSFAIALHLEARHPARPLLFLAGEGGVAAARFVERWAAPALHILISRMIIMRVHDALDPADQTYFRGSREKRFGMRLESFEEAPEALRDAFAAALEPARRTLHSHEWLGGESPLFADYILFGTLMWLDIFLGRLPLAPDDEVTRWFERCLDLHGGLARGAKRAAA
jgi:glutathione S-transferase